MQRWQFIGCLLCVQLSIVSSQESPFGFCAVRASNLATGTSTVPFTSVPLNDGNAFNPQSNSFTVPSNSSGGLFWLAWSVGLPPSSRSDVRLLGYSRAPNILRGHTSFTSGADTTSRTELIDLRPTYDTITLSSDFGLYSDAGWQTSFCGFSLFSTMTSLVAFSVGKSTTTTNSGTLIYNIVTIDTHSGYNTSSGVYTIPTGGEGVYVVSFSVASIAGNTLTEYSRVRLCLAQSCFSSIYVLKAGEDLATHTVLVDALQGQALYTTLDIGPAYSDIRYQTSLMGFLYNPARILPNAWSVAEEGSYTGPVDPLPFEVVFVNRGSGWSVVTNTYTVQASGVYYVHLSAGMYTGYPTKMELLLNGQPNFTVLRESIQQADYDTRGRAFMLRLAINDQLRIRLPSNYRIYSTGDRLTSFSGFRVY